MRTMSAEFAVSPFPDAARQIACTALLRPREPNVVLGRNFGGDQQIDAKSATDSATVRSIAGKAACERPEERGQS